ncbi:MAG: hypothetical protein ACFE9Z_15405 [Promethearchaeota archaeon]
MKKLLILILIGFITVSIFTIIFTVQSSRTFTFEDDNGDNGDDHYSLNDMNLIEELDDKVRLNILGETKEKSLFLIISHIKQKEIMNFTYLL